MLSENINTDNLAQLLDYKLTCKGPCDKIYSFEGTLESTQEKFTLTYSNFLLRGSSLRNTEWILGVVAYTGHETRIMMNSTRTRPKKSALEVVSGWYIICIFLLQCVLCFIAALYQTLWCRIYESEAYYLEYQDANKQWTTGFFLLFLVKQFFTWILLFTNMVPISLLVTLEIVKFFQAMFISWDVDIFDEEKGLETVVLSNNLNEELG